ncbi:nonribosomal peptide synthase, putative [Talaromyces stipitatus ATCC 10500]|uniref:Nonribosomal peptide synthase, putative n=1 Tax=Talaromyces stipitatus (strain ATCC 10500 / CBS 375.48 / QM 6759 / NRRL 1006) TaxID=441959 RepID=B8M4E7_TALSN|nr:nonribosomal peptide synthase, putative [Talaromyces stipitatus ATCC 10500]EED19142.1 nonribosomal peptide synthase, putative [Talaromyces stipitatus ATCC 10500]
MINGSDQEVSSYTTQSKKMLGIEFLCERSLSSLEILAAWTILIKDYVGPSDVGFSFTDTTTSISSSNSTSKPIVLEIDEGMDLQQLCARIKTQLLQEEIANDSSHLSSSFRTHLWITDEDYELSEREHGKKTNGKWTPASLIQDLDLTIKCTSLNNGKAFLFTVIPESRGLSRTQATRISHQLQHLLGKIDVQAMEERLVYKIDTASDSDIRQIWRWNSHMPPSDDRSALDFFKKHVRSFPDAPAINAWDGSLTYAELDKLSSALSRRLADAGIGQGNIVPLCFEKSKWTPVAILAVLKTGAAFVLVDEVLPEDRLRQISQILSQEIIVVVASLGQKHRAKILSSRIITVDFFSLGSGPEPHTDFPQPNVKSTDLICVVFTSGTTGVPKAAMIKHSNLCAFSSLVGAGLSAVKSDSRVLALASYSFDVSVGNIFMSLLNRACLCIPSSWECKNDVANLVQNYEVTHVVTTPSISKMLQPSKCTTLQVLDLGGEACSEDALAPWRNTGVRVINSYSPAECTVESVLHDNILLSPKPSIIGKCIGATWIMDPVDRNRLAPVGAVGELVLEGPQVGLGYLHDPKTTLEKFIEDPEWLMNGLPGITAGRKGRLYRTGDLVRYTDDGLIDYIGRRDFQVKIRGQRVELGEVAANLQRFMPSSIKWCPEVIKTKNGTDMLCVFVVLRPGEAATTRDVLQSIADRVNPQLRKRLHPSMVPGVFAPIEEIPLSLTGKTDRRALRQIGSSLSRDQMLFVQDTSNELSLNGGALNQSMKYPNHASDHTNSTNEEMKLRILREVWSEVLGVDLANIRTSDTFFGHGGESLTAIRFVGAASRKGIQLDVASIFQHPQLSDLASHARLRRITLTESPKPLSLLDSPVDVLPEVAVACGTSIDRIEDVYPCTPLQEGLITADNVHSSVYTGRGHVLLPEDLDVQRFIQAWQRVMLFHPILRTRIVDTQSHGLLQVVLRESDLLPEVRNTDLVTYLKEDGRKKMGLGTKLCRWAIVREPQAFYFVLTMHHSIYDGWTLPRIAVELFKAYQGVRIETAVGFNVFAKYLKETSWQSAREFWAHQLAEPQRTTVFPAIPLTIQEPRADSSMLKTFFISAHGYQSISMPSLLRAAWALLISKLSFSDDITFGATVSGRNVPITGIEDLTSPTITTVPVRVKIDRNSCVSDFVANIQNEAVKAMPFENLGLQNIRKINSDTRLGSRFQTLFIVQPPNNSIWDLSLNTSPPEQELKTKLQSLDISSILSDFNEYALMIIITQKKGELIVEASYDSRILDPREVKRLLDQFSHVTEEICRPENIDCSLQELSFTSTNDVEEVWQWNAVPCDGRQEYVHQIIQNKINLSPQAQAICAWDGTATYEELDKHSAHLAYVLQQNGVGRGSLVPICMEKSIWAAIAMLGILRAGAGFVAIDVIHQPEQRIRTIVDEVKADVVVTAGPAMALAGRISRKIIACDQLRYESTMRNKTTIISSTPSDTAFVVFTSGSTGRPKGIIITHENFCSTIDVHQQGLELSETSRVYDYASYSFDIAVHNTLMTLASGGCVCIPSEDDRENDIEGSIERLQANWADLTPSVARLIDPTAVPALQVLVLSGEAVGKDLVQLWAARVKLINAYGPAECQICTIQRSVTNPDHASNIGLAVGCNTWIVDPESNSLSAIGAVGELVIEGPIVSPGYINEPGDSFVSNPPWLLKGSATVTGRRGRVYRTGDLACYMADGTILYCGRATTQTKINGQRIELSEIEYHIKQAIPDLSGVVADTVNFDGDSDSSLTAFLVYATSSNPARGLETNAELTVNLSTPLPGLLEKLSKTLPGYMIPVVFLNVSHLPLTPTRKIDRRKLKDHASRISRKDVLHLDEQEFTMSKTALDEHQVKMVRAWAQVLKIEPSKIGLYSDFFQLGGDSISAMRLVAYLRKAGYSIKVSDVFRQSRLDRLVDVLDMRSVGTSQRSVPASAQASEPFMLVPRDEHLTLISSAAAACNVNPRDILDLYPCTPFQEGVFALTSSDSAAYVQHAEIKFSKKLHFDRVLAAWNAVIEQTPILRTRIVQLEGASLMQVVVREAPEWKWYETAKEYLDHAGSVAMSIGDPLSRFGLLRDDSESSPEYSIFWTAHHAVYDSWTIELIFRQVTSLYHGEGNLDLGPNYGRFARFLRDQQRSSEEWWKLNLSSASSAAVFPKRSLTKEKRSSKNQIIKKMNVTLPQVIPAGYSIAILLRAAWAVLIARYTGGDKALFGETRLGRGVSLQGVESMKGPTTASVPVLVHVNPEQTIASLLEAVRESSIQMQEFEHLGLQNIARLTEDSRAACNFQSLILLYESEVVTEVTSSDSFFRIDHAIDDLRNFNAWPLMLVFHQRLQDLSAEALFDETEISSNFIELLLQQMQGILNNLCSFSGTTLIRDLDKAYKEDLAKIWEWNAGYPEMADELLHNLVAKQARRTPDKVAVTSHDGQMTFKELDEISSSLALTLRNMGVGHNCVVPLCFEKSVLVPLAMLAVSKAGAAFSAMDITYPEERLKVISSSLGMNLILASPSQGELAKRLGGNVFIVDSNSYMGTADTGRDHFDEVRISRKSDQLMYVCFTSGSTGVPKGVMITHRNLASAVAAQGRVSLGIRSDDRVYDFSSHAFDVNIWSTWVALAVGACVCIPSHEERVGNLAGSITSFRSTTLFLTPSVARTIEPTEIPTVKRLYLGGEAVTPVDVSQWQEHVELWGAFGPTETTPLCSFSRLDGPESATNIGRGVGVNTWICDPDNSNQLMAIGAAGELLSEGPLVSPGYRGLPERTAAAFIEDPEFLLQGSAEVPGRRGRLYKTGDLVRYSFDGTIEYIGRVDTQVKLRGQRVDFGEIEYHLKKALPDSTAIVCEIVPHPSTKLPLLVVFCEFSTPTASALDKIGVQAYLRNRLPPYMIPEQLFTIPQILKGASGKIDRQQLKLLGSQMLEIFISNEVNSTFNRLRGPFTQMQDLLERLWSIALGQVDMVVSLDSDFFHIGGDSVAAMKLSNLARKHDLRLTVKDVIETPDLLSMAGRLQPIEVQSDWPRPFSLVEPSHTNQTLTKAATICDISADSISDIYPCTPLQVELFALTMKQSQAYMKRSVFEVQGDVSVDKLIQAWDTVMNINAVLRTRFVEINGLGLLQVVVKDHQWKHYDSIDSYLSSSAQIKPDLGKPLSQLSIVSDSKSTKIVWTIHHALYDMWSIQIIQDQLCRAYQDRFIPRPPRFSGFVQYLQSQNVDEARLYWGSRLAGCREVTIYPSLPSLTYQVRPSKTFKRTLRDTAGFRGNIQAKIHAAWALIVSKLSGSDDVVFAATLAGRNAAVEGLEQMVGPTITPVPIRIQLETLFQCSVEHLLAEIEKSTADMAPYQHIGMKNIEVINADTRAACKFQTLIVVTPPETTVDNADIIRTSTYDIESLEGDAFHTFALVLFFFPKKKGIDLEIVFDPMVLEWREIELLGSRLEATISALTSNNKVVSDVDCLGQEDLQDIWKWNATLPVASEQTVDDLILKTARMFPEKVAIDAWNCKLSYSQLDSLSWNLSTHLRCHKVGRGSVVPILSPKSGYVPIAALAVLRTGAALLPLDFSQPFQRLQSIIQQVAPQVVLASELSNEIADYLEASVLIIEDCLKSSVLDGSKAKDESLSYLDDVACVLFTSGSTGTPKGVMQTHRALSSAVTHQGVESGFNEGTRAFEFASYSFDVSWNMIFKILAVAGTLCIPSDDERNNDLVGSLNRFSATLIELTASVARLINPNQLHSLQTLILSGEPVFAQDFEHWRRTVRLVVCYGPSECTSVSTMNPGLHIDSNKNGIGKGYSCVTWIVDPHNHQRLMPIGAVGEILIDGPIVGEGYYNNEALTNASYVSDLPWIKAGYAGIVGRSCRVFKSGDLARYDLNGNIHFVSRKDTQVKLHGQRIELEEVQFHVQKAMEGMTGPVVSCLLDDPGSKEQRLVAFISSNDAATGNACEILVPGTALLESVHALDEKLGAVLPKYMLPSLYYFINTIPRTTNGKVDRKKLVRLALDAQQSQVYRGRPAQDGPRRTASSPMEIKMQQLWSAVLGVPPESIWADDNFFDLDGDSIGAMRLVAAARSEGYELRVSDVFESPRLSQLAPKLLSKVANYQSRLNMTDFELLGESVNITAVRSEAASRCAIPDPNMVEDIYPCTPLQESMLAATIRDPSAFISMRLYGIPDEIDIKQLQYAWKTIVTRHRILRTRLVDLSNHGLIQAVIREEPLWKTYNSLGSFLDGARNITMGPGSRLVWWALVGEPQQRRVVWVIHHTLYDGWTLSIIEEEIKRAYLGQRLEEGQLDMRPLINYIIQEPQEASIAFWGHELRNSQESTVFPSLPNHNYQPMPDAYLETDISVNLALAGTGVNLSAFFYGTWGILASHITATSKLAIGAILTGRNTPVDGIDRIIGPTITTVPILIDVDPSLTVSDFMARLELMTIRRISHEHLGVHNIRQISSTCASACNFQTVLVIQPPSATNRIPYKHPSDQDIVMEELDETKVDGFPNGHAVLNQYGLMFELLPVGDKMTVRASFDSRLISHAQINRMIRRWEHVIKQVSHALRKQVAVKVEAIASLCTEDLETIWKLNKDLPCTIENSFVHGTISAIARRHPEAPAIDAWDGQLTYGDLETLSSRLAERLIEAGVGPGKLVPLIFRKSIWANVSMLGVMKAGGAFVPLDHQHPEGHLRAVVQTINTNIILCSAATRDRAARLASHTIMVDESLRRNNTTTVLARSPSNDERRTLQGGDLAYAVFTSGSTGGAKGVRISHTNLATAIHYQVGTQGFHISSHTRSLDSSSYSFDACIFNFFYTASQGGCLCVPSDEGLKGDLGGFMAEYRVNWAQLVPSVARTINPDRLTDLDTLILTGEPLTQGDIVTWSQKVNLVNVYGPTECTILCAISSQITHSAQAGNIGRGRGANLWLTEIGNPNKLAPIGTTGEILIEGPIIGAGYLGPYQYPLVKNPPWLLEGGANVSGRSGTLFRTGDQARYADDGSLIFMGRIGSEIKIRGQKVDLIAIEDIMRRYIPTDLEIVADIVHLHLNQADQDRQMLLAFVSGTCSTTDELQSKLHALVPALRVAMDAELPSYLQPEAFVPLPTIPRTSSGKTDRRRLKDIGQQLRLQQLLWIQGDTLKTSSSMPSTEEEQVLATIWGELLGLDYSSITREDDFFKLGGDSLGVMRLTTRAHERGLLLKPSDIFQDSNLATMARKMTLLSGLARGIETYRPYSLVPDITDVKSFIKNCVEPSLGVEADQVEDIIPTNGFQIDYMNDKNEPLGLQYCYLDIGPDVSWPKLKDACRAVVQAFECLRARFVYHQGKYYQVILQDAPLLTEEIFTTEQVTTFSNRYCPADGQRATVNDIFTKLTLVDTGANRRRVILRMSHMQYDGWCTIHIFRAIATLFNGGQLSKTLKWTELLQYRQRMADDSRKYWRALLQGTSQPTPPLLYKPSTGKERTLRTHALPYFHASSDNKRTRPTVVVNVAWALVLQQLAGHSDIVFGNVTTGRNGPLPGLDSVIGPSVNMLPMRLCLPAENNDVGTRKQYLRDLVEASAQQVDERTTFEGLDWEDTVDRCTSWPSGSRYSSAVHFRNMAFEPELPLGSDGVVIVWHELKATPHWTTVLVYPENDVLRLWLLANPAEIGDDGADEILHMLASYVDEIVEALRR